MLINVCIYNGLFMTAGCCGLLIVVMSSHNVMNRKYFSILLYLLTICDSSDDATDDVDDDAHDDDKGVIETEGCCD